MTRQQALTESWTFHAAGEGVWHPAQVPGCVHTDLHRNGIIEDPFYGTNERKLQGIDKSDWEYRTLFVPEPGLLQESRVELVFEGLDTFARVSLNGHEVLHADNMFRSWRVDVKPYLTPGQNELRVYFESPITVGLARLEANGYPLPSANDNSESGELGDRKVSVFLRKAPYHFGWDWGPRFVTSGIWKPVRLEAWSGVRITDLYVEQVEVTTERAVLKVHMEVESESEWKGPWCLEWEHAAATVEGASASLSSHVSLQPGLQTLTTDITIDQPRLWWSRGLGAANLYTFHSGVARAIRSIRTGLRTIRLDRHPDERGTTFQLVLNGVPVFAKGANHIPNDSFAPEVTRDRYRLEIASAVRANMNMIRVWGGGYYEHDDFYDLCDEYGVLVWQDFMFACSMYPGDDAFLQNVRAEAYEVVRRLRRHPSIALYCGNNEMDAAWSHYIEEGGWGWKKSYSAEQRERIWADYESIFHRLLPEVVAELSADIDYWPSSPMNALTREAGQHSFYESTSGDLHYWGVWHGDEPFENYKVKIGRFMSEYGFQSFPELKTVLAYAEPSDLYLESDVMTCHQKNNRGNQIIKDYTDRYLKEPKDFVSFLYMSQVLQAEAIKSAIEAHRRAKPFCMGTLYWQLNDCWPVASWASLDYFGRWKALHYAARHAYQDVLLSADQGKDGSLTLHLVSDRTTPVEGSLRLRVMDFHGGLLRELTLPCGADALESRVVYMSELQELLGGHAPEEAMLLAELLVGRTCEASALHYFAESKRLKLEPAVIEVKEVPASDGSRFELRTNRLAKHVVLDAEAEGIFSDNYFDLLPGVPKEVAFYAFAGGDADYVPAAAGAVTALSMADHMK